MIGPRLIFSDEEKPRIESLQKGDVVVKLLDGFNDVFVCCEKKVTENRLLQEENLRVGASYLQLERQLSIAYKYNASILRNIAEAESFRVVVLDVDETRQYRNAVQAYERVVATLVTDIGQAVTMILLEDDEGAVNLFGQSQGRWKKVRLSYISGETYVVFELESRIFLRHGGERFLLRHATPSFVSEKYFEFLEPQVSLIVGVLTSDKEEIIDAILDASLFPDCFTPIPYEKYVKEKSLLEGIFAGSKMFFVVKGSVSNVKKFLGVCEKIEFYQYSKIDYSYTFIRVRDCETFKEERGSVDMWRCTTRRYLLTSIIAILLSIFDEAYVTLEILDKLDICFWLPNKEKIDLIFAVKTSICRIRNAKSSNKHRKIDE